MENGNAVIYISEQTFEDILCGRKRIVKPSISHVIRMGYDTTLNALVAIIGSPDLPELEAGKLPPNVSDQVAFEDVTLG